MADHCKKISRSATKRQSEKRSLPFRLPDLAIIVIVAFVSLIPLLLIRSSDADTIVVSWHGTEIYRGPIADDAVITTPDNGNTIVISNGSVYLSEADCPDLICVNAGKASPSHPVICLPNRVIISVIGSEEVDSVSW